MNKLLFAAFLLSVSSAAFPQFAQVEGEFSSKFVEFRTILLDAEKGIVAASATIVVGACSGSVAGTGRVIGKTLTLTPYVKVEGGEACSITAEFDSTWKRVKIIEGEKCSPYHGASCGWEGQVVIKRPPQRP